MSIKKKSETDILEYINKQKNHISEKNKYGEVFTNQSLIEELVHQIPDKIWKNPDSKWLDPAAGTGNFMLFVYNKLLKSLSKKIPNLEKRKNHILDNMLYMVELNPKNSDVLKKLFGNKANIFNTDFLKSSKELTDAPFDVILGNPPYQVSKKKTYKGSVGNRTLWDKFLDTILNNVQDENISLDEIQINYIKGHILLKHCEDLLQFCEQEINEINPELLDID